MRAGARSSATTLAGCAGAPPRNATRSPSARTDAELGERCLERRAARRSRGRRPRGGRARPPNTCRRSARGRRTRRSPCRNSIAAGRIPPPSAQAARVSASRDRSDTDSTSPTGPRRTRSRCRRATIRAGRPIPRRRRRSLRRAGRHAVLAERGEIERGAVPRHVGMIPGEPQRASAVGRQAWRGKEIVPARRGRGRARAAAARDRPRRSC